MLTYIECTGILIERINYLRYYKCPKEVIEELEEDANNELELFFTDDFTQLISYKEFDNICLEIINIIKFIKEEYE